MSVLRQLDHDLRTPLNVVIAYAELLRDEPDPARRDRMADAVLTACRQMTDHLDNAKEATR